MYKIKRSRLAMKSKDDLYSIRLIKSGVGFVSNSFTCSKKAKVFVFVIQYFGKYLFHAGFGYGFFAQFG